LDILFTGKFFGVLLALTALGWLMLRLREDE
jgi:hypothetical protein